MPPLAPHTTTFTPAHTFAHHGFGFAFGFLLLFCCVVILLLCYFASFCVALGWIIIGCGFGFMLMALAFVVLLCCFASLLLCFFVVLLLLLCCFCYCVAMPELPRLKPRLKPRLPLGPT